jgi:hypothetical protein
MSQVQFHEVFLTYWTSHVSCYDVFAYILDVSSLILRYVFNTVDVTRVIVRRVFYTLDVTRVILRHVFYILDVTPVILRRVFDMSDVAEVTFYDVCFDIL